MHERLLTRFESIQDHLLGHKRGENACNNCETPLGTEDSSVRPS